MNKNHSNFYKELTPFNGEINIFNKDSYHPLPADWFVIVTDIKGSTQAIRDGHYKNVNVISVSSIIAAKNAAAEIDIPYIFGGDGALIFAPQEKIENIKKGLSFTKMRSAEEFNLDLRISIIPIQDIYERGAKILIAKMKLSPSASIAMADGDGLALAEKLTKQGNKYALKGIYSRLYDAHAGFECKWNPIPSKRGEMLTLIIKSVDNNFQTYADTLAKIGNIAPHVSFITPEKTNITISALAFFKEVKMKHGGFKKYLVFIIGLMKLIPQILSAKITNKKLTDLNDDLTKNTDHIKYDNCLRMVIDVTQSQKNQILDLLNSMKDQQKIDFGSHSSKDALITCFVISASDHIHFVDGNNGGYTEAAREMKNNCNSPRPLKII